MNDPATVSRTPQQPQIVRCYRTAWATDIAKLDEKVNEMIDQGFQPYGDPYIYNKASFRVCQAMVSGSAIRVVPASPQNEEA